METSTEASTQGKGPAVDAAGQPVVDPSENVKALVIVEKEHARDISELRDSFNKQLRESDIAYQNGMRAAETNRISERMDAETRRIDGLAALREKYDARIAEDLRVNVKTTSDQLAGQLVKETGSLSGQIGTLTATFGAQMTLIGTNFTNQIATLRAEIIPSLAELNKFRFETGGRTSVTDPATELKFQQVMAALSAQKGTQDERKGATVGSQHMLTTIISVVIASIAVVGFVINMSLPSRDSTLSRIVQENTEVMKRLAVKP